MEVQACDDGYRTWVGDVKDVRCMYAKSGYKVRVRLLDEPKELSRAFFGIVSPV